jgi:hypothetical protein
MPHLGLIKAYVLTSKVPWPTDGRVTRLGENFAYWMIAYFGKVCLKITEEAQIFRLLFQGKNSF